MALKLNNENFDEVDSIVEKETKKGKLLKEKEKKQRDCHCVDDNRSAFCYFVVRTHNCTFFVGTNVNKKCQTSLKFVFNP